MHFSGISPEGFHFRMRAGGARESSTGQYISVISRKLLVLKIHLSCIARSNIGPEKTFLLQTTPFIH